MIIDIVMIVELSSSYVGVKPKCKKCYIFFKASLKSYTELNNDWILDGLIPYYLTLVPLDMKLVQACQYLPVLRGSRSSNQPWSPYTDTVLLVNRPPVMITVWVSGSSIAQAML